MSVNKLSIKLIMPDDITGQNLETEGETVEELPASEKPEEQEIAQASETEPTLPDGVKERTAEEFEKLKARNKALAEKVQAYESAKPQEPKGLDNFYAPNPADYGNLSQQQVTGIASNYIDKEGYVDVAALNQALTQANAQSRMAIDEARRTREEVTRYNHSKEVKDTYTEYPELDPESESYDEDFYEKVENEIYGQLKKGQSGNFLQAAHKVAKAFNPRAQKEQAKQVKEQGAIEAQAKRVQATTPVGGTKTQSRAIDQEELIDKSRKGDMNAIADRLRASGY